MATPPVRILALPLPTPLPRRNRWVLSLSRPAASAFP